MEQIDHLVVGTISFREGARVNIPESGVEGLAIVHEPVPAPAATEGSPSTSYGGNEQGILTALQNQVNALTTALIDAGVLTEPEAAPEPEAEPLQGKLPEDPQTDAESAKTGTTATK